jgi:hypothetical protein
MARRNVALASNGGTAAATTTFNNDTTHYGPAGAINGNRTISDWGSGGGWSGAAAHAQAGGTDTLTVTFSASILVDEIDVITYGSSSAPTLTTPVDASYGATAFTVEYLSGATWVQVASVTGNAYVWRQWTGLALTTTAVRVTVSAAPDATARLVEVEAWGDNPPATTTRRPHYAGGVYDA